MEAEKVEAKRKEAEKQGEFEKLYQKEQDKSTKLEQDIKNTQKKTEEQQSALDGLIQNKIERIPEDKREFVEKMLDGKSELQKIKLLPKIHEQFGSKRSGSFGAALPGGSNKPNSTDPDVEAKTKKFKELEGKLQKGELLSSSERRTFRKLSTELSKARQEGKLQKQKLAEVDPEMEEHFV